MDALGMADDVPFEDLDQGRGGLRELGRDVGRRRLGQWGRWRRAALRVASVRAWRAAHGAGWWRRGAGGLRHRAQQVAWRVGAGEDLGRQAQREAAFDAGEQFDAAQAVEAELAVQRAVEAGAPRRTRLQLVDDLVDQA